MSDPIEKAKERARTAFVAYMADPGSAAKLSLARRALESVADAVADDYWQPAPDPVNVHRFVFGDR